MAVGLNLYALPEGCIANALSLTSPKDACRLSLVGSAFRSAAQSDDVWERFLPPDYLEILSRSNEGADLLRSFRSKKEFYFYLCHHPILIDGGMKSFSLEKGSGKKCYMLAPRDLTIVWSDVLRYWRWISIPESRFPEVGELVDVCWLEIVGKIKTSMLSPATTYAAYLVFTTKSNAYGLDFHPAEASVGISQQEEGAIHRVFLDPDGLNRQPINLYLDEEEEEDEDEDEDEEEEEEGEEVEDKDEDEEDNRQREEEDNRPRDEEIRIPRQRGDWWMEVELGEFYVDRGQDEDLEMRFEEVNGGNWKSGLIVGGIEIRPKPGK